MTTRSRLILPLLLAAICTAQEDPGRVSKAVRPVPPIVTMSFQGGTMAQFVAAVRVVQAKSNIVVAAAAADAKVPAMELKAAGLDQVLESACAVASSEARIRCVESKGSGEPVFAIVAQQTNPAGGVPTYNQNEVDTIVLSLNRLTEGDARYGVPGLKVETILSAIEASSYFEEKGPMLRYHEDSGLLFLRGTNRQVSLASEVLQILERDQTQRSKNSANKRGAGVLGTTDK